MRLSLSISRSPVLARASNACAQTLRPGGESHSVDRTSLNDGFRETHSTHLSASQSPSRISGPAGFVDARSALHYPLSTRSKRSGPRSVLMLQSTSRAAHIASHLRVRYGAGTCAELSQQETTFSATRKYSNFERQRLRRNAGAS